MANKIFKDELLTDEQLDAVTGGSDIETMKDFDFLNDIGLAQKYDQNGEELVIDLYRMKNVFANAGVKVKYNVYSSIPNEYQVDGKNISRREAMQRVLDANHTSISLDKYM